MAKNILNKHVHKALEWINEINDSLEWDSQAYALDALRAVLHQLRDNLPTIDAVHLGAQFPLIIRGIYFEEWRPSQVPFKQKQKQFFIESVRDNLERYTRKSFEDEDVEFIIRTVFQILSSHIDDGESGKLLRILPFGIADFIAEEMGNL